MGNILIIHQPIGCVPGDRQQYWSVQEVCLKNTGWFEIKPLWSSMANYVFITEKKKKKRRLFLGLCVWCCSRCWRKQDGVYKWKCVGTPGCFSIIPSNCCYGFLQQQISGQLTLSHFHSSRSVCEEKVINLIPLLFLVVSGIDHITQQQENLKVHIGRFKGISIMLF